MTKSFDYFDHEADIGLIGRGASMSESFEAAAQAVFFLISPKGETSKDSYVKTEFFEDDPEFALVEWLNFLIAKSQAEKILFKKFKVKKVNNHWLCEAWGGPWNKNMEHGTDVKGATLTMLSVRQKNSKLWESRCVVDV